MNGQDLINITKRHIDDAPDDDTLLDLMNIVKDMVEGDRPWRMLIKENSDNTFTSAQDYTTAKDLPDDFLYDTKLTLGIASSDNYTEYIPCAFEDRRRFNSTQRYCVDVANKKFYILGNVDQTYTIYLYYVYETDPITLTTSPVWPVKYQRLIPLLAAEIWKSGIDADIFNLQNALAFSKQGNLLFKSMVQWDSALKLKSMNNRTPDYGSQASGMDNIVPDSNNLL